MNTARLFSLSAMAALATTAAVVSASAQTLAITEVYAAGSGNGTYAADWFELTNFTSSAIDLTGWKMDDSSAAFGSAVALRGVTSIAAGQSIVFLEGAATNVNDATIGAAFVSAWFGASAPGGFTMAFYGGSGVGLSSSGDGVNLFDSGGTNMASVSFGASTTGQTFDNVTGTSGAISTLSVIGVNGAFQSFNGAEVGSPGTSAVPEPSTYVLAASLGALGFAALRRRSSKRA